MMQKRHKVNSADKRLVFKGIIVSPGVAAGRLFHYRDVLSREVERWRIGDEEVDEEIVRVHEAIEKVKSELHEMQKRVDRDFSAEHAAIFGVHLAILEDEALVGEIERELKEQKLNSEHIVKAVFQRWAGQFESADEERIRMKSQDMLDIGKQVYIALQGLEAEILSNIPDDSVIFAKRLLTSDTVHLNRKKTRAIITEEGSKNAHSALLAREMNIPAIVKIDPRMYRVPDNTPVIVDGTREEVIINPRKEEIDSAHRRMNVMKKAIQPSWLPEKIEIMGKPVRIYANVATPEDASAAVIQGCDGVGLFRIEQIYMKSTLLPDEEYLMNRIGESLRSFRQKTVSMRLLDLGGDKTLPYLPFTEEKSTVLGMRGIRLLLRYPELLETQLSALFRLASEFKIRILVPMVSLSEEMIQVRQIAEIVSDKLQKRGVKYSDKVPLGAMVETPAAVLTIHSIIEQSGFLSIGTNDLIQYTMAADREKMEVSEYYEAGAEIILESIRPIVESAEQAGIECSLCGELAGDTDYTEKLTALGLRYFSVSPYRIPKLREKLLEISKTLSSRR